MRLAIFNMLVLIVCLSALTLSLNYFSSRVVDTIDAIKLTPSNITTDITSNNYYRSSPLTVEPAKIVDSSSAKEYFLTKSFTSMLVITLLGGTASYLFAKHSLKPLNDLNNNMSLITASNLDETLLVPKTNDEIKDLTIAFNNVLSRLDKSFKNQKYFAQNVAHKLKTPLTIIKTKIDVFKKKDRALKDYNDIINLVEENNDRLNILVSDLLKFSNLNEIDNLEKLHIKELFLEVIQSNKDRIDAKNLNVLLNIPDQYNFLANYTMIYQVINNLIDSAIKYNMDEGFIAVKAFMKNESLTLEICNSGLTITNDDKEHIFEPFFRVDKSRNRNIAGSGLGLANTKAIIEAHNASISLDNSSTNQTVFKIIFNKRSVS